MTDSWKQWEGQVVDGRFHLHQYLGCSPSSAVFLAEYEDLAPLRVALKLMAADPGIADQTLERWTRAAKLSHPRLIRLYHMGRSEQEGSEYLYLVCEYADDNLGQLLPHRPLTETEARETLIPLLDALSYMHAQGFVHGRVRPANILAVGEQIKLTCDSATRTGDSVLTASEQRPYDAPETSQGPSSPAADVWSLGVTLCEVLTQQLPLWDAARDTPALVESLPTPYAEIAQHCLVRDPQRRCSLADIASYIGYQLTVTPAPATSKSVAPKPSTQEAAQPASSSAPKAAEPAKPQAPPPADVKPQAEPAVAAAPTKPAGWKTPALILALVLGAIVAGLLMGRHSTESTSNSEPGATNAVTAPAATSTAAPQAAPEAAKPKARPAQASAPQAPASPVPTAALPKTSPRSHEPKTASSAVPEGDVVQQVVPEVPGKALATIQGTVRVGVKVEVDAAGNVSSASLISAGPSPYFANLALQAARGWKFTPLGSGASPASREWHLRFEFRRSGATVIPSPRP